MLRDRFDRLVACVRDREPGGAIVGGMAVLPSWAVEKLGSRAHILEISPRKAACLPRDLPKRLLSFALRSIY